MPWSNYDIAVSASNESARTDSLVRETPETPDTEKKKVNRTRSNKITVYLNDAELARINAKVDRTNMNREQFIRKMIEGLTIIEAPPAPLWQTVCMMKRALTDLRSIADHSYFTDVSDEALLRQTVNDICTCVREITERCLPEERKVDKHEIKQHRPGLDRVR